MRGLMFSACGGANGCTLVSCTRSLAREATRNARSVVLCLRQRGRHSVERCTRPETRVRSAAVSVERGFLVLGPCVVVASRPNRSVERTSRLRRSSAHFRRYAALAIG